MNSVDAGLRAHRYQGLSATIPVGNDWRIQQRSGSVTLLRCRPAKGSQVASRIQCRGIEAIQPQTSRGDNHNCMWTVVNVNCLASEPSTSTRLLGYLSRAQWLWLRTAWYRGLHVTMLTSAGFHLINLELKAWRGQTWCTRKSGHRFPRSLEPKPTNCP